MRTGNADTGGAGRGLRGRYEPDLAPHLLDLPVAAALQEDLGHAGDITSQSIFSLSDAARAVIAAREPGVIAGLPLAEAAFRQLDPHIKLFRTVADGDAVNAGDALIRVTGAALPILAAERVALNYLGHLSGIASRTASFVAAIEGTGAKICCTRKTTPGLRALQKYAVRAGGGVNHRFGLFDAVLIKDNHIAAAGGVEKAIRSAQTRAGHLVRIEVEVDNLEQLEAAMRCHIDAVLLDNMTPEMLEEAVRRAGNAPHKILCEASGGVTLETVREIAETGVDLISVGGLTHSAPSLDLGLDFRLNTGAPAVPED